MAPEEDCCCRAGTASILWEAQSTPATVRKASSGAGTEQVVYADRKVVAPNDISPDGKTLATKDGDDDRHVDVWDLSNGRKRATLEADKSQMYCIKFSPDGKWLLTGILARSEPAILWDSASWKRLRTLNLNQGGVRRAAFSPDGRLLATAGDEFFGDKNVRLWDTKTWIERGVIRPQNDVEFLAFSPDGQTLIVREQNSQNLKLWDPFILQERQMIPLVRQLNDSWFEFAPQQSVVWAGF